MADAIVSLSIQRISDLLIHEAVFLNEVRDEVDRLKDELMRMQSFLRDADHKQEQDERLRNRVVQIRDLAYRAEDVIDSFILESARQAGGCRGIVKRFTSIFTKPVHLHNIGVEIKAIQTNLDYISKRLPTYEISGEPEGPSSISNMQRLLRRTYSHVEEVDVVSLEGVPRNVLAQLMREDENRPHVVVSIVGIGGIGKTTLAKRVYQHVDVKRHFDCLAWAFISQQCKRREVVHDVLIKVLSPSKEERERIDKLKEDELIRELSDALKEKRYLVVLDDIWRIEHWNMLKPAFPRGKKGSKILFTTRNKEVALLADPCMSPIELPFLTNEESWKLFNMKAFPENTKDCDAHSRELEMLGREMVKKCGGLPLAIVVLGGLLATKKSPAQWEMVQRNIHAHLNKTQQQDYQYNAVNGILALSYNDLPYCLKPCFLYLGYYPEDWEISKKELIRLWIAEGFIPQLESGKQLMEDVAEQFLEELINRCLVQVVKRDYTGTGVKTCRIHDLVRDLCMDKAKEEKFLEVIQPPLDGDVILSASMLRRIAVHPIKRYALLEGEHPNLRSLFLFRDDEYWIEWHLSKCKEFKFLRVLKVARNTWNWKNWNVSSEIGNLHHLRYLGLECTRGKIILPSSIGKLRSLHTLHIQSYESVVPVVAFKLERLRHILICQSQGFRSLAKFCLPPRCSLKNVVTLKYISLEYLIESNALLSLMNIQNLGVTCGRSKYIEIFLKAVILFQHLRSLKMEMLYSHQSFPDLEPLSQCHDLSKLYLSGIIVEDPHSRHHVLKFVRTNITKLTLWRSHLKQDPMAVLEKLPHLRILRLVINSYEGTRLSCSANGFLQLDSLLIDDFDELEEWEIEEGAMPCLRSLHLRYMPKLKKFPEGLKYLTALQEIEAYGMKRSLVERIQVIEGREGDDFSNVSHIPSIQILESKYD